MIDKNLVLVAAKHTPTALKEPCVWQHQTAESVADLPQDERVFAGDLCVFAASDGTKTAFRYEHYWECDGEKKFDVYVPEVISDLGTVTFTVGGEEVDVLTYGDTVTVTVTADSGYQVKTITLNGEEIENNSEFTVDGDITLTAEFEEAPVEDVIWEDSFEFEATEGAIGYEGEYIFPAFDKINTTDFFTLAILELDKSITAKFEIQDEEANSYSIRDTDETIVMVIDPTDNYIIIVTDQGDTAGTYTVKLTKSEAPAPSAE